MTRPENDDNHLTKAKLTDDIVMTLGGRVAEELIIKDISAGAAGDIQAVSKRARLMVSEWGMSEKVGPVSYASEKEIFIGRDMASHVSYSEETAAIIDEEVQRIINEGLERARELLSKNKKLLDVMARVLVERETIFTEEVDLIMKGKSAEEVIEFMDKNERTLSQNPFERKYSDNSVKEEELKPESAEKAGEEEKKEVKPAAKRGRPSAKKSENESEPQLKENVEKENEDK